MVILKFHLDYFFGIPFNICLVVILTGQNW